MICPIRLLYNHLLAVDDIHTLWQAIKLIYIKISIKNFFANYFVVPTFITIFAAEWEGPTRRNEKRYASSC